MSKIQIHIGYNSDAIIHVDTTPTFRLELLLVPCLFPQHKLHYWIVSKYYVNNMPMPFYVRTWYTIHVDNVKKKHLDNFEKFIKRINYSHSWYSCTRTGYICLNDDDNLWIDTDIKITLCDDAIQQFMNECKRMLTVCKSMYLKQQLNQKLLTYTKLDRCVPLPYKSTPKQCMYGSTLIIYVVILFAFYFAS